MFGIGSTELLVILVVALIVLGPKSIPQIAKTLGKAMAEFRRVSTDFQRTLNAEVAQEEHEKRKKEAEQELFGDKNAAAPSTPSSPEQSAAKPASAMTADTTAKPAPAQAEAVSPAPPSAAEPVSITKSASVQGDTAATAQPEPAAPSADTQTDTPLSRAVAKAAAEARDIAATDAKPAASKTGESA